MQHLLLLAIARPMLLTSRELPGLCCPRPGSLHEQELTQHHPEVLCAPRQLPHPLRHVPGRPGRRVLQRRRLGADHNVFEFLTEGVAALGHPGPHLGAPGLPRQRVPDEDQLVGAEDDELAVSDEDLGRLVGVDGGEEGIDGVGYRGDVVLTLLLVEEEELPVAMAKLGGGRVSSTTLGKRVGQRMVRGRDPARHVVVNWLTDFLFELFKLLNLEEKKRDDVKTRGYSSETRKAVFLNSRRIPHIFWM